jgi:predicted RNase H-like nuclease (RuvC/YqgF family)
MRAALAFDYMEKARERGQSDLKKAEERYATLTAEKDRRIGELDCRIEELERRNQELERRNLKLEDELKTVKVELRDNAGPESGVVSQGPLVIETQG